MAQHKELILETIQTERLAPAETDDLRNRRKNRRTATGRKIFNRGGENGSSELRTTRDCDCRSRCAYICVRRIHLPVREQCHRAMMLRGICVRMKPFVKLRAGHQHIQEQQQPRHERGHRGRSALSADER
jgi:hypothetical protein